MSLYKQYCDYSVEECPNEDHTEYCITVPSSYPKPEVEGLGRCTGMYDLGNGTTMYCFDLK